MCSSLKFTSIVSDRISLSMCFELISTWYTATFHCFVVLKFSAVDQNYLKITKQSKVAVYQLKISPKHKKIISYGGSLLIQNSNCYTLGVLSLMK